MNRTTLIAFVASLSIVVVAIVAHVLTFRAIGVLQEESFLLAQEIEAIRDKEAQTAQAEEILFRVAEKESVIETYFVSEDTIVDFLELLESIEENTVVAIDIISVSINEEEQVFDINLTIEGRFGRVMQTLEAIENLPVFIVTESGSIETIIRDEGDDPEIWTASVSYNVAKQ